MNQRGRTSTGLTMTFQHYHKTLRFGYRSLMSFNSGTSLMWSCGGRILLCHERRFSTNQAAMRRCDRNFQVGAVSDVLQYPQYTTDIKVWEILMCAQSLNCFKSKYLWLFSPPDASRDTGGDLSCGRWDGSMPRDLTTMITRKRRDCIT